MRGDSQMQFAIGGEKRQTLRFFAALAGIAVDRVGHRHTFARLLLASFAADAAAVQILVAVSVIENRAAG